MPPFSFRIVRRKRVWISTLLTLTLLTWGVCLWPRPSDADTALRANFDHVPVDTSLDEAKIILGPPLFVTMMTGRVGEPKRVAVTWEGEATYARVYVDRNGVVVEKEYGEKPLSSRLRGWWRRTFGKGPP